jgi:hypothetical protein
MRTARPMIDNITTGFDPSRMQNGEKKLFFVSWTENGRQEYRFFQFMFDVELLKKRLTASLQKFWEKLNNCNPDIYLRFQRRFAKQNDGKWIRGLYVSGNVCGFDKQVN